MLIKVPVASTPEEVIRQYIEKQGEQIALTTPQPKCKKHIYQNECGKKKHRDNKATLNIREEVRMMLTA